jgi:CrcB protein
VLTALLVAVGAAIGAPARYLTDRAVRTQHDTVFPWGTLAVNVVASLLLGLLTGAGHHWSPRLSALLGTGLCATLSTYSTFGYENHRLFLDGARFYALTNILLSLTAGIGAAALGWSVGVSLT